MIKNTFTFPREKHGLLSVHSKIPSILISSWSYVNAYMKPVDLFTYFKKVYSLKETMQREDVGINRTE